MLDKGCPNIVILDIHMLEMYLGLGIDYFFLVLIKLCSIEIDIN